MSIRLLESSLQSWSLFFLGKQLCIIAASEQKGKFPERGRRMTPKALYGELSGVVAMLTQCLAAAR